MSLFIDRNKAIYFDSLKTEYTPQDVSNKIKDKRITCNIFRIQSDDFMTCGFYCITFFNRSHGNC